MATHAPDGDYTGYMQLDSVYTLVTTIFISICIQSLYLYWHIQAYTYVEETCTCPYTPGHGWTDIQTSTDGLCLWDCAENPSCIPPLNISLDLRHYEERRGQRMLRISGTRHHKTQVYLLWYSWYTMLYHDVLWPWHCRWNASLTTQSWLCEPFARWGHHVGSHEVVL